MPVNSNDNALLSSSIKAIGISLITGFAKTPIKIVHKITGVIRIK